MLLSADNMDTIGTLAGDCAPVSVRSEGMWDLKDKSTAEKKQHNALMKSTISTCSPLQPLHGGRVRQPLSAAVTGFPNYCTDVRRVK